jgi:hypothetical protein
MPSVLPLRGPGAETVPLLKRSPTLSSVRGGLGAALPACGAYLRGLLTAEPW